MYLVFKYLKAGSRLGRRLSHVLQMHGDILLIVWVQQLQQDASPILVLTQLTQITLQTIPGSISQGSFAMVGSVGTRW